MHLDEDFIPLGLPELHGGHLEIANGTPRRRKQHVRARVFAARLTGHSRDLPDDHLRCLLWERARIPEHAEGLALLRCHSILKSVLWKLTESMHRTVGESNAQRSIRQQTHRRQGVHGDIVGHDSKRLGSEPPTGHSVRKHGLHRFVSQRIDAIEGLRRNDCLPSSTSLALNEPRGQRLHISMSQTRCIGQTDDATRFVRTGLNIFHTNKSGEHVPAGCFHPPRTNTGKRDRNAEAGVLQHIMVNTDDTG